MCKHNDRLNTFFLKLFCIFLNSYHFIRSRQEVYAYKAGRGYLTRGRLRYNTDKSDFHAAYFFYDVRIDDRLIVGTVYHIGIDVIKISTGMGNFIVLRINTAENLCFQCWNALVKLMVAQCSDIKSHHVHPYMCWLVTFK
ncbi:hypothetical protein D3C75_600460 [compost metagenome]